MAKHTHELFECVSQFCGIDAYRVNDHHNFNALTINLFLPMLPFHTLENINNTSDFLVFLGGIKCEH